MNIHEWCIALLKGRTSTTKCSDLFALCAKHYRERTFDSEDELLAVLEPFKEYFSLEVFRYDYVTFVDDGMVDISVIELAKDVLRSHSNRYTLSVLCRKMNEAGVVDAILDDALLKAVLSSRHCFTIEGRSMKIIKLSAKGEEYDVAPIVLRRSAKSNEEKEKDTEQKRQRRLAKEQERLSRKVSKEEERERKRMLRLKRTEDREEHRIEKVKMIISHFQITDETILEKLWADKLIKKEDYVRCSAWGLHTVGQVYAWVVSHRLPERLSEYRKHTVQRMMKIASFHDPELARLIPSLKFQGIQRANRGVKLQQPEGESENDAVDVELGDLLRWNYTKEVGMVVGFDYTDGDRKFIVRQKDGKKVLFEDDPRLFTKLEREEIADKSSNG